MLPSTRLALSPPPALPSSLLPRVLLGAVARTAVLALLPDGGQRVARRNAWAGMSSDAVRSRARREADSALEVAVRRPGALPRAAEG